MDSYDGLVLGKPGDREPDHREPETRQRIQALLDEQPFAVLCTQGGGQPSSALFRCDIVQYQQVSRFQEVHQWIPKPNG